MQRPIERSNLPEIHDFRLVQKRLQQRAISLENSSLAGLLGDSAYQVERVGNRGVRPSSLEERQNRLRYVGGAVDEYRPRPFDSEFGEVSFAGS